MAQGRSTKIIQMMKWIRTSRLSTKNSFSACSSCSDWNRQPNHHAAVIPLLPHVDGCQKHLALTVLHVPCSALTVLYVPHSLDSGTSKVECQGTGASLSLSRARAHSLSLSLSVSGPGAWRRAKGPRGRGSRRRPRWQSDCLICAMFGLDCLVSSIDCHISAIYSSDCLICAGPGA